MSADVSELVELRRWATDLRSRVPAWPPPVDPNEKTRWDKDLNAVVQEAASLSQEVISGSTSELRPEVRAHLLPSLRASVRNAAIHLNRAHIYGNQQGEMITKSLDTIIEVFSQVIEEATQGSVLPPLDPALAKRIKESAFEPDWRAFRIVEFRVAGIRAVDDVRLKLGDLTVLIGENGAGKSTLLEALELLRQMAGADFGQALRQHHGGLPSLLRFGEDLLSLGVSARSSRFEAAYSLVLGKWGFFAERLICRPCEGEPVEGGWLDVVDRSEAACRVVHLDPPEVQSVDEIGPWDSVLTAFGVRPPHPAIKVMQELLQRIEVHLPFRIGAGWASRVLKDEATARNAVILEPTDRLSRFGLNLANAYHALRNDFGKEHWDQTMSWIHLGLGDRVEVVNTRADAGGGRIALSVKVRGFEEQIPAFSLSDGVLTYLAFVALCRLHSNRSLLAFDEPEIHLHPELLVRVLTLLETLKGQHPVILATHSDRLLDALVDPAEAAVLVELDDEMRTVLRRPDREALEGWLEDYRGLGALRADRLEGEVMTRETP